MDVLYSLVTTGRSKLIMFLVELREIISDRSTQHDKTARSLCCMFTRLPAFLFVRAPGPVRACVRMGVSVCVWVYVCVRASSSNASMLLSDLHTACGRNTSLSCGPFPRRWMLLHGWEPAASIVPPASINSLSIYYNPTGWSSWLKLIVKPLPCWFNRLPRALTMTNSLMTIIHHKTFAALR